MDELKASPRNIPFRAWDDVVKEEVVSCFPYHKYLSDLGEGGKEIKKFYDDSKRYNNCRDAAKEKNKFYQEKMKEVLEETYNELTIEEKKYIIEYEDSYRIGASGIKAITNPELEQNSILESIKRKTNGQYEKIFKYLKLSYKTYRMETYNGIIETSTFEKIDTSKAKQRIKKST